MNIKRLTEKRIKESAQILQWSGSGLMNDPYIIDSNKGLPSLFWIINSNLYIKIKNCSFKFIGLKKTQNIIIENCSLEISMYYCHDNILDSCTISTFGFNYCYNNLIKNSFLNYVDNRFSRGNQFENNKIPSQFINGIIEGTNKELFTSVFKFLPLALLLVLVYLLSNDFVKENPPLMIISIIGLIVTTIVEISILIPHYLNIKKLKTYPLNKIL